MKKIISLLIIMLLACCDNTKSNISQLELVAFEDYPCHAGTLAKTNNDEFKMDYAVTDGLLEIEMNFSNVCGSAYRDSIIFMDNELQIFLQDTSDDHARCVCPHQSFATFNLNFKDRTLVKIYINPYAHDDYYLIHQEYLIF